MRLGLAAQHLDLRRPVRCCRRRTFRRRDHRRQAFGQCRRSARYPCREHPALVTQPQTQPHRSSCGGCHNIGQLPKNVAPWVNEVCQSNITPVVAGRRMGTHRLPRTGARPQLYSADRAVRTTVKHRGSYPLNQIACRSAPGELPETRQSLVKPVNGTRAKRDRVDPRTRRASHSPLFAEIAVPPMPPRLGR